MNCISLTEPSRWIRNPISASSGVLCCGRCQRIAIWTMMLLVYAGNGKSIPSVDTVRGSLPVEGRSPGSGCVLGVVRGAASRLVLSATGGGGAGATVFLGDFALG